MGHVRCPDDLADAVVTGLVIVICTCAIAVEIIASIWLSIYG